MLICSVFRVQPDDLGAHINVGRTLESLQLDSESEQAYRNAIALLRPVKPGACLTININMPLNINDAMSQKRCFSVQYFDSVRWVKGRTSDLLKGRLEELTFGVCSK